MADEEQEEQKKALHPEDPHRNEFVEKHQSTRHYFPKYLKCGGCQGQMAPRQTKFCYALVNKFISKHCSCLAFTIFLASVLSLGDHGPKQ
eukprot:370636-Amphidinium_carterae.2